MDSGSSLSNEKSKISNNISNARNVLQSVRIRRSSDVTDESNRILFRSQFAVSCFGFYFFFSQSNPLVEIRKSINLFIERFR